MISSSSNYVYRNINDLVPNKPLGKVPCLCVVCALSMRCLCAVCALSVRCRCVVVVLSDGEYIFSIYYVKFGILCQVSLLNKLY